MARPNPEQLERSKSLVPATLSRYSFPGWWRVLSSFVLSTEQSRNIGTQGIPGACVGTLKHQIVGLKWRLRTEDGDENADTEYYTLLLENARDGEGNVVGCESFLAKGIDDILKANEGWNYEIVRVPNGPYAGVPVNLIYIDAATLEPTGSAAAPVRQILDGVNEVARFAPSEIGRGSWEQYNTRGREWFNLHPILKNYVSLAMLAAEDDYTYELLTNVIPQGLLNLGTGFDREKATTWKKAWEEAKAGGKLNDIALLYGTSDAKFLPFTTPPSDMPFQHASYWYLTVVTANFEMSPFDLGFMTQINTRAGSEATVELSKNKGLRHLLNCLRRSIQHNVLPRGVVLEFPDLDPSDEQVEASTRAANTDSITKAVGGPWMSADEGRKEANRLKVYELDTNTPFQAPEPAPEAEQPEAAPTEEEPSDEEEGEDAEAEKAWRQGLRDSIAKCYASEDDHDHIAKAGGEDYAYPLTPAQRRELDAAEAEMQAAVIAAFDELRGRDPYPLPASATEAETWAAQIADGYLEGLTGLLIAALIPGITRAVGVGITAEMTSLGIPLDFSTTDPAAMAWVQEHGLALVDTIRSTTRQRLTQTLIAGWRLGEDMDHLAARVQAVMQDIPDWRALTIGRTETIRAFNGGAWLLYKESGIVVTKVWVDGQQGACAICKNLDGEEVKLDDPFSIGVMFAPAHPRCRCAIRAGKLNLKNWKARV